MELHYSIITGAFYKAGVKQRAKNSRGYLCVTHNGKSWLAHRLAYHVLGVPLPKQVDHIDGVRQHNAWHNLRDSDNTRNQEARHVVVSGTGYMGVYQKVGSLKFFACIRSQGKAHHLGSFNTAEEASAAYQEAKQRLHTVRPGL